MTLDDVIREMLAWGLPALPNGVPILDGKIHRFGKGEKGKEKNKAWYRLREVRLNTGKVVITGSFGRWQGRDPGTVPVTIDWGGVTDAERADLERRQAEVERADLERKLRAAE